MAWPPITEKLQVVGTTVFRCKFLQIQRASLIHSVAHRCKFSRYSN